MTCGAPWPAVRAPLSLPGLPGHGQAEVGRVEVGCGLDAGEAELGRERVGKPAGEGTRAVHEPAGQDGGIRLLADILADGDSLEAKAPAHLPRVDRTPQAGQQIPIDEHGNREPAEGKLGGGPPLLEPGLHVDQLRDERQVIPGESHRLGDREPGRVQVQRHQALPSGQRVRL